MVLSILRCFLLMAFQLVSTSIGLVDAMVPPQMVFVAGEVFADLLTMLTLDPRGVSV